MASNNKQGRSTPITIWVTAVVIVVLGIYALHSLTRQRITVHTAQVSYQDLIKTASTNGKVELTEDFQPRAQAPGRVDAVYVKTLEHVHKGQLLLKLDDAAAEAALAHAEASLQAAEVNAGNVSHGGSAEERATLDADLNRANQQLQQDAVNLAQAQKLQSEGAASAAEVSAAQRRIQIDESNLQSLHARGSNRYTSGDVSAANAQVADARAGVAAAQSALANDVIRSPIDGTVYYMPVVQYGYVNTGDELIDVADLSHMRVTAYFDEPDIGALAVGQPVTITWEAKPGNVWHGHISQTPTTIIPYQNRFVGECLIDVDDADNTLTPSANVNLHVTLAKHPHVLAVPREALHFDHAQPYVFRVVNGRLVRTNVSITGGVVTTTYAEIVSGLSEGETVATLATGDVELADGESVTTVPGP